MDSPTQAVTDRIEASSTHVCLMVDKFGSAPELVVIARRKLTRYVNSRVKEGAAVWSVLEAGRKLCLSTARMISRGISCKVVQYGGTYTKKRVG